MDHNPSFGLPGFHIPILALLNAGLEGWRHQAWLVEGPWESLKGGGIAQGGGGGGGGGQEQQQQDTELGSMLAGAHFHIHRLFIGHPTTS